MRTLVIGFGNPSRRDDGVGFVIVNGLRARLGLPPLDETIDGYDDLGGPFDTLFLQQMTPELAETLADYDRVFFVDAHVAAAGDELIRRTHIDPSPDPALVSHHFKPGRLLALAQTVYGRAPQAELISVHGFDFDFGPELTPDTAHAAEQVVNELWNMR